MNRCYLIFLKCIARFVRTEPESYLFESHEDFSEGTFRLYQYLKIGEKKVWWYISKKNKKKAKQLGVKRYILSDGGFIYSHFLKPFLYYKIKYICFSHRFPGFPFKKAQQFCLFFDHGQPFKYVPNFQKQIPEFAFRLTNNHFTGDILNSAYGVPFEKMIYGMNPRILPLLSSNTSDIKEKLGIKSDKKIIVCLPTWNRDLYLNKDLFIDFPIMVTHDDFNKLDAILEKAGCLLVFKFHPMVKDKNLKECNYTNIQIIDNHYLLEKSVDVYDLLSCADCLITDYSSIFIDYYLTNKPVIFLGGNFEAEERKHDSNDGGFVFSNYTYYMCGPICYSFSELLNEINKFSQGHDDYFEKRKRINAIYNGEINGNLCDDLLCKIKNVDYLGGKK